MKEMSNLVNIPIILNNDDWNNVTIYFSEHIKL